MSEINQLTLEILESAVAGKAAAFRSVTHLQPAGGPGDKIFPPTYEGGKYAVEERVLPDGQVVPCVLLDSVQSQANRMELALLEAVRAQKMDLPLLKVVFDDPSLKKKLVVTSLEAPHRAADAIFRDSLLDGKIFRQTEKGKLLDVADITNATGLFGLCPTALLFGLWDSTGPRGGLGAKFQRAIVSEIVGYNALVGVKTSSRIDPLQIVLGAGPLFVRKTAAEGAPAWTRREEDASSEKGKCKKLGKDGKPSEANHGNVTPGITQGGFTITWANQTTVLSLPALRRLRFPLNGNGYSTPVVDDAARTALAALGLAAAALVREQGLDLRSRCQLFPAETTSWELLDHPGSEPKRFSLEGDDALGLFQRSLSKAIGLGLPWEGVVEMQPHGELTALVARSQELAVSLAVEEE